MIKRIKAIRVFGQRVILFNPYCFLEIKRAQSSTYVGTKYANIAPKESQTQPLSTKQTESNFLKTEPDDQRRKEMDQIQSRSTIKEINDNPNPTQSSKEDLEEKAKEDSEANGELKSDLNNNLTLQGTVSEAKNEN